MITSWHMQDEKTSGEQRQERKMMLNSIIKTEGNTHIYKGTKITFTDKIEIITMCASPRHIHDALILCTLKQTDSYISTTGMCGVTKKTIYNTLTRAINESRWRD